MNALILSRFVPRFTLASLPHPLAVVVTWNARYRMRRELARLDPHLLRDIGLSDCQARHEAAKPFWSA
jgi:uncharacterized protein YjiS (DUF1127 family)